MRAWEAAVGEARRVIAHDPDDSTAYAYMAQAFLNLKRYTEGLEAAEAAIRRAPDHEWHHRLRSLHLSGLDRPEEALQSAEEAFRLAPNEPEALFTLANCQWQAGLWMELLQTAQQYERLAPDREAPHHFRGWALWSLGDVDRARAALEQGLSVDPTCAQLHAHLGCVLLYEGHTAAAIERILQSLRMRPDIEGFERLLCYAVRRHLDLRSADADGAHSSAVSASVLATQLHVLALRMPGSYRLLFLEVPPALEYQSPFAADDSGEIARVLDAWRAGSRDEDISALTDLGLPSELVRSLADGKTAHYPTGLTVDDMLRHWMVAVLDLERGSPRDAIDHEHDRGVRDAIDVIVGALPPGPRAKAMAALAPWDARFQTVAQAGTPQ